MLHVDSIRLLIAEDEANLRSVMSRELARRGYQVTAAEDGTQAAACLEKQEFDVLLLDVRMPGMDGLQVLALARELDVAPEVVMLTGNSTIEIAVEAMKLGACDFVNKPSSLDAIDQILRKAAEKKSLLRENLLMKRRLARKEQGSGLIFGSEAMRKLDDMIRRIAPSESTVLISGESGTGKELAAHAIHDASHRAQAPFVDINCGAIPENLLESELFGYEKGSFTGADAARPGLFEMAHRGTLFLDEIGELPLGLQVKLLRVLETKSFYRVGGRRRIDADVRVIAATNRTLATEVDAGRFRKDLFFRINALELAMPPLREHPEDIPLLARHFATPKQIAPDVMELLIRYSWPGNVRELKNVIERAALIGRMDTIEAQDLPAEMTRGAELPAAVTAGGGAARAGAVVPGHTHRSLARLDDVEKQQIIAILEQVRWHRGRAAELLGISQKTLYRKLRSYGINN
jgi:two-component system NtrC family response regulator